MAGEAREKCAVAGVMLVDEEVNSASAHLYEVLFAQQHRGDEASGMVSRDPGERLIAHRELGMVKDVYNEESIERLVGRFAIGHNRYSTSGRKSVKRKPTPEDGHPQPVVDETLGLALGQNGNTPDHAEMDAFLGENNLLYRHRNDSEKMGFTIAQFMRNGKDCPDAIAEAYPKFTGAFSCVGLHDNMMFAFRDPYGIRPLALGKFNNNWVISSETCGLNILNAKYQREVEPGELVIITDDGELRSRRLADERTPKLDVFEFVYFARHDSKLYGQTVNEVRRGFGQQLAIEHGALHDDAADVVVVPVPDTSIPIAEGYAHSLGLTMTQAIVKNRYIGRTFMQPTPDMRERQLRRKHNIIGEAIKNKDVILVDDSVVRLNTLPNLVSRAYAIGAKSVSVLIGSPPVRFPDFYGIDTPKQTDLAAANMSVEQMRQELRGPDNKVCKYLGFLPLDRMIKATGLPEDWFNLSCFTGDYPIDIGRNIRDIRTPASMEYVY